MEEMVRDALELLKKIDENNNEIHIQQVEQHATLPFRIGESVSYRIPVIEAGPSQYTWSEHRGVVQAVDFRWQNITVIPTDEAQPWRIVAWCYARRDEP